MSARYPLAPLMEALRIQALEHGWHNRDQLGGRIALADACGVSERTIDRWAADGIPERHIDHLAINKPGSLAQVSLGAHLRTHPSFSCNQHTPTVENT